MLEYLIKYTKEADKIIKKYKKSNPAVFKKLHELQKEIRIHLRTGTGHPEPLTKGQNITYSRRLTANDRVIYNIYDDEVVVLILSVEGHYGDK
jgi:toxin YoeB